MVHCRGDGSLQVRLTTVTVALLSVELLLKMQMRSLEAGKQWQLENFNVRPFFAFDAQGVFCSSECNCQ